MTLVDKGQYGNLIKIDEKQAAIKKALGLPALLSKKHLVACSFASF